MSNLIVGQYLLTTTNEKVKIVEVANSTITVLYKGNEYVRPKTVVGDKLFLIKETTIKGPKKENMQDNSTQKNDTDSACSLKTCKNCLLYRSEECFGQDSICDYFKQVPSRDKDKYAHWPKEMTGPYGRYRRKIKGCEKE